MMASETGSSEQSSFWETLINSIHTDISLFLLFVPVQDSTNSHEDQATPRDRIILNPFTQSMVVIESITGSDSSLSRKNGQRPASKASIDSMPVIEIVNGENCSEHCVVCLEEWEDGEMAKEMPCRHRFHGKCIDKWLRIRGSCPVCRNEMPVDEDDGKETPRDNDGERRRGFWVSFRFGGNWRTGENNQTSGSPLNHQET